MSGNARIKEVFLEAMARPDTERSCFLIDACGGDSQLRQDVEELLNAHVAAGRFLNGQRQPEQDQHSANHQTEQAGAAAFCGETPGTIIDRYKLLQRIGEGGFGTVFMAEQIEPVVRRVALKIIKAGMDTRQVIARFEAERQALALMDHPNIARVLDAGATATGRPYFVMELVRGEPVTAYCDRQRFSVRQRLELFRSICSAVQHAHQKGIIHRDIKPSNVLVTITDAQPIPKVIDFGIAKATAARLTDRTLFTELHQLMGTPVYMSPEQAEANSSDIDTRSDVYSLGVLLYELLTGTTPFDPRRLRESGYDGMLRILREEEPPRPSLRLHTLTASSGRHPLPADPAPATGGGESSVVEIAHRRQSEPQPLTRALRGDLDWIVMKCLEKDRRRRYDTASALADDIERFLASRPVLATPPSALYKLRKFADRNRGPVLAGATCLLLLVGGLAFSLAYWQQAESARTAEERQRRRAEASHQFVLRALQTSDPHAGGAQDTLVADAMMRALEEIDAGAFADDPVTAASLLNTISSILDGNARFAEALRPAEQAVALLRRAFPGDHEDIARYLSTQASVLQKLGREDQAEPILRESLAIRRRLFNGDHAEVAAAMQELATVLRALGRAHEAEPLAREALAMRQRLFAGDHPDVATSLNNLANVLRTTGNLDEARSLFQQALDMRKRLFPGDHPDVAQGFNNMGFILHLLGRHEEAMAMYRNALDMRRRLFKGDHPDTSRSMNNLATLLASLGRYEEAAAMHRELLTMRQRLYPGDHPEVATSMNNLAHTLMFLGRYEEAESAHRECLAMRQRLYPNDHPDVADSLANLGTVLFESGRAADAEPYCRQALEMRRRLARGDHPAVAHSLKSLSGVLHDLKQADEAESLAREALEMRQRLYKGDHELVAQSLNDLGRISEELGRHEAAEQLYRESLSMQRRVFPGDHPESVTILVNLAERLVARGDIVEAESFAREAVAMQQRLTTGDHPVTAQSLASLARCLHAAGRTPEARELISEAAAMYERLPQRRVPQRILELHDSLHNQVPPG